MKSSRRSSRGMRGGLTTPPCGYTYTSIPLSNMRMWSIGADANPANALMGAKREHQADEYLPHESLLRRRQGERGTRNEESRSASMLAC